MEPSTTNSSPFAASRPLCLLAVGDSHGYGLKSRLEATTGETWQINIGQIYTTLQRLERDGLVVHSEPVDGREVYSLTEAGRVAVSEWMAKPVDLAVAGRDDISLKILMAVRSGIDDPRRVIERSEDRPWPCSRTTPP